MICPECGKSNIDYAKYCQECGDRLKRYQPAQKMKLYAIIGAAVVLLAAAVVLMIPRAKLVVIALTFPEQIVAGDDFVITVNVINKGRAGGARNLVLNINENEYSTKEVFVNARADEEVQFEVEGNFPAGVYRVSLENLNADVRILKPAEFILSQFSIEPNPLRVGEEAGVAVDIANLGEVEGSYTLYLEIDGEVEQTKEITLAAESSKRVFFTILKNEPGNYRVALKDLSEVLEVWQIVRPNNGTVIMNTISGGYGHLSIYNGNDQDCVVILASPSDPEKALLLVYVRSKSRFTVTGIRNGTYLVYFATGEDWESYSKRFTKNSYYNKFDKVAEYTAVYPSYTIISVDLNIAGETGSKTERIPEHKFPR